MNRCRICFKPVDTGVTLLHYFLHDDCICGECRSQFIENHQIYETERLVVHAFYIYNEFLEKLLFQYKEGKDVALAEVFFYAKQEKLIDMLRHKSVIVMPSSEAKCTERGFHHLEKMLQNVPAHICHLFEKSDNYKQSEQDLADRHKIFDVLKLKEDAQIPNQEFILFDDVVTSGNTLKAAAQLLGKSDKKIHALALCVHPLFVELCDEKKL